MNLIRILTLTALLTLPGFAADKHDHDHGGHNHAAIEVPSTLAELWPAIVSEQATLKKDLETKNGEGVHKASETLVAYVNALPELAPAEKKDRVGGLSRNLAKTYDQIHHLADDGAFEKALSEAKKTDAVIKLLEVQLK